MSFYFDSKQSSYRGFFVSPHQGKLNQYKDRCRGKHDGGGRGDIEVKA
jgi:hypothetical protein